MKLLIAGSREITNPILFHEILTDFLSTINKNKISAIISGHCRGVDILGEEWAKAQAITLDVYPANWSLGKAAGPIRNKKMAQVADLGIIIAKADSRGSQNMLENLILLGKFAVYYTVNNTKWSKQTYGTMDI